MNISPTWALMYGTTYIYIILYSTLPVCCINIFNNSFLFCDEYLTQMLIPYSNPFPLGDPECQNNGSCYNGYCNCNYGYSGKYCEIG